MGRGPLFSEIQLAKLREVCRDEGCINALYRFEPKGGGDCLLVALFDKAMAWPRRLDLELAVAEVLGLEGIELIDLRRMPLVFRHDVLNRGEPIYVGAPEQLAIFIEGTIARYAAYYPILEALYWKVETGPLSGDMLDEGE
jgi:hypothetical protein